jgi:hypothetical protein
MVMKGQIPPTAEIDSPNWFAYVDPARTPALPINGKLAPSRVHSGGSVEWVLEYALGADPADADFHTISSGTASHALSGRLGTLNLAQIPPSFYEHAPTTTLQPDGAEQYTVTLRLRVRDANGLKGEDRRSIGARHDSSLAAGLPKHYGAEISGPLSYVDLRGRHQLDLIFSTYDGDVHALDPSGRELGGFPVHSDMIRSFDRFAPENFAARAYRTNRAFRDLRDPLSGTAVGDMEHNGQQDIVATGMNGRVYAWDAHGRRLHGFPQSMPTPAGQHAVPTPRSPTPHSRDPLRGAWAFPVLAPLQRSRKLDVIIPGWDGKVYAWQPNGRLVPGWPVEVKLPQADFTRDGVDPQRYIRDPKLMYSVGVADVMKTGRPQVFVSSFECSGQSTSTEQTVSGLLGGGNGSTPAKAWLYGIWGDGRRHQGGPYLHNWPVALSSLSFCYDLSIDFVGEGVAPPTFANLDGSGLKVISSAVTGAVQVLNPDGSVYKTLDTSCPGSACSANPPYRPTGDTHTITLTGQGGLGDLTGSGRPQYIQSSTGVESIVLALGQAGEASLPQVYEKAWDPSSGSLLSGFPQRQDGFPFYDAPIAADVGAGGGHRNAIEANDNYWIHAWGPDGAEAPGFPKYTGQWVGFVGTVADPRMNGQLVLAYGTREGDLFVWNVDGSSARNDSWWHYRHDEWNTGQYGLDTRPPAPVTQLRARRLRSGRVLISFIAPGGDWMIGQAARYQAFWRSAGPQYAVRRIPRPHTAGTRERLRLSVPRRARFIAIRALDAAGNSGDTVSIRIR